MPSAEFVHMRTHSAFSLLEGALPVADLTKLAVADNQPALALTDTGNLFGALEFSEKAIEYGLQPIVGCQLDVKIADDGLEQRTKNITLPSLVFIASNDIGYENLMALVSKSYFQPDDLLASHVTVSDIESYKDGLIILSGGPSGPIDQAKLLHGPDDALSTAKTLRSIAGDNLYIEIQRHQDTHDADHEAFMLEMAYDQELRLVATNEPYFGKRDDFAAHDALIAISEGKVLDETDRRRLTSDHYFKTRSEMKALFEDLPEACDATLEIAMRCTTRPRTQNPIFPQFIEGESDPEKIFEAETKELREQAKEGLKNRIVQHGIAPDKTEDDYWTRLDYELGILEQMRFPGYFLIVADFIKWAKLQDIPVGPGRGSGAGSLVAYALTITDLDPLCFALLFERFLNPERVSLPDFDIDFCQDRREEVIRYVQEKYGKDHVAQIITFGSLQARAVLRDVGRVLQMPYGQVDRLCKMVPANPANPVKLQEAIDSEARLQEARDEEPIVAQLLSYALKLEGLYRHASTHAAGIVIGDRPLDQIVPLYRDPRSDMPVTQFNMKWVEKAGLVKFDFLGLKTLTVLQKSLEFIKREKSELDLSQIPLDDKNTYDLLSTGESVGIFQLESMGMRKALVDMRPDRFEDIIALVALYRPGPMANIPVYCARKHKREKAQSLHPDIDSILDETFGVIVYQEQVMQIAQVLAGASLGQADLLRRAMGKKIKSEMDAQRQVFIDGATKRGIKKKTSNAIFDLLAKFAEYGFNKSHAAAYALVAYQTAYLKTNYPVEFFAGSMTLDMGNTDKINDFCREVKRLGYKVVAPSINRGGVEFDVEKGEILYSLAAIKGVGRQAIEHIVEVRDKKPFTDLADFAERINPRFVNRRIIEGLIASGAFDELDANRARLMDGVNRILAAAQRSSESAAVGQGDIFGAGLSMADLAFADMSAWSVDEKLQREFSAIGFYFTAHPLDQHKKILASKQISFWTEFSENVKSGRNFGRIAGTVAQKQERRTRTGGRMGVLAMSDPTGQYEAVVFSDQLGQYREILEVGSSVVLHVTGEDRDEGVQVRVQKVELLDTAMNESGGPVQIFVESEACLGSLLSHLNKGEQRDSEVKLVIYEGENKREIEVTLPGRYKLPAKVGSALRAVPGIKAVQFG